MSASASFDDIVRNWVAPSQKRAYAICDHQSKAKHGSQDVDDEGCARSASKRSIAVQEQLELACIEQIAFDSADDTPDESDLMTEPKAGRNP